MTISLVILCTLACSTAPTTSWAEAPSTDETLDRMFDAVGGLEAYSALGVLELNIREEETTASVEPGLGR